MHVLTNWELVIQLYHGWVNPVTVMWLGQSVVKLAVDQHGIGHDAESTCGSPKM